MLSEMLVDKTLFAFICVFAGIGAFFVAIIVLYVVAGVIDLTYHERHKTDRQDDCPDKIEREDDHDEI